jgi:predicted anti-sigma-YlaC factor YlaD
MQLESRLCSRARFWVSLRLDDQLSELEGALLDSHLAACPACSDFAASSEVATTELRDAPPPRHAPVQLELPRRARKPLVVAFAAAVIVAAAIAGGVVRDVLSPAPEPTTAPRPVAVVASSVESNDQFRQLRRTSLLGQRPIPRDLAV